MQVLYNPIASLYAAVFSGCRKKIIQALIHKGADVNAASKDKVTAIMKACEKRRLNAIRVLLKAGSDANSVDKRGQTCLMSAVYGYCTKEVLQALIDHGADVNANTYKDSNCLTALMLACAKRNVDAIHVLLKAGSNVNIVDNVGQTCLMRAVHTHCCKEVLQAIIDHGADVNARSKHNITALTVACDERHVDAIHVLLKAGSNANVVDNVGQTYLMRAVHKHCCKEVLQAIIDHGADVNATDKYDQTALMMACFTKHVDVDAGSDTNIVDKNGFACLMDAVRADCCEGMLQTIIDRGASVNATDKANATALMMACYRSHSNAIHVLLKAGSDVNIADNNGMTCLMHAVAAHRSQELLQAIIDHGAEVNATTKDNTTALMLACQKRHIDAIHVLLKVGSDANIASENGDTCLMYAVHKHCSEEVLQAIIDHGADVNATSNYNYNFNYTALIIALDKRHVSAIHVLLKAGFDTNIVCENGTTCLKYAVMADCSKEVLQAIIHHGADVNASDGNITPLMLTSQKANIDTIKLLLNAGAEPTIDIHPYVLAYWILISFIPMMSHN